MFGVGHSGGSIKVGKHSIFQRAYFYFRVSNADNGRSISSWRKVSELTLFTRLVVQVYRIGRGHAGAH